MPELPELEVICEVLSERILCREIERAFAVHPHVLRTVEPSLSSLEGQAIRRISRRGKHLIFEISNNLCLVMHLMLSGRLILCKTDTKSTKATVFAVSFKGDEDLRLIESGTQRKASVYVVENPTDIARIASAGVEPLSEAFTVDYLAEHVHGRRRQLKKTLTDQTVIAGIGSAYADEVLFDAKLSPIRYGTTVTKEEVGRLYHSIQSVLRWAIEEIRAEAGGAALTPHGRSFTRIYKKTNQPCPECGTRIAEIRYAQTKTYYCPHCQSGDVDIKDRRAWLTR